MLLYTNPKILVSLWYASLSLQILTSLVGRLGIGLGVGYGDGRYGIQKNLPTVVTDS